MEHFLIDHGYLAILALAFIQSACIPIPSEVTFGYAGVLAYQGHLNIVAAILIGVLGEMGGSSVAYLIGRLGGRPLVERFGKYLLLTPQDLDRVEIWLDGRGEWAIGVGRGLPVLRLFVSIFAGIAEMVYTKFLLLSFLGTLVYGSVLAGLGYGLGSAWTKAVHDFKLAGYVLAGLVVVGVIVIVRHRLVELRRAKLDRTSVN